MFAPPSSHARSIDRPRDDAATPGSAQGHTTVWAVAKTEERVRSSISQTESSAREASTAPPATSGSSEPNSASRAARTSPGPNSPGRSWPSTHSPTAAMSRRAWAATQSRPESRISAWASQKSMPPSTPARGAASHRARAARWAPSTDPAPRNGDQRAVGTPVVAVGS